MPRKVRIASLNAKKIELDDGSSVTVKGSLDFKSLEAFVSKAGKEDLTIGDQVRFAIDFLKSIIVDWDFVDEKGGNLKYTPDLVEGLDIETIQALVEKATPLYSMEKKSPMPSAQA